MSFILESIKYVGSLAGLASLYLLIRSYLKIKIEADNEALTILTEIENTLKWPDKKIDNAFIIIAPENLDIVQAGQQIAPNFSITSNTITGTEYFRDFHPSKDIRANDIPDKSQDPLYLVNRQIGLIPLSFYYSENIRIGDEKLTYRCSVDPAKLNPGRYSVRFFIYRKGRFHRSSQDLLTIHV